MMYKKDDKVAYKVQIQESYNQHDGEHIKIVQAVRIAKVIGLLDADKIVIDLGEKEMRVVKSDELIKVV